MMDKLCIILIVCAILWMFAGSQEDQEHFEATVADNQNTPRIRRSASAIPAGTFVTKSPNDVGGRSGGRRHHGGGGGGRRYHQGGWNDWWYPRYNRWGLNYYGGWGWPYRRLYAPYIYGTMYPDDDYNYMIY